MNGGSSASDRTLSSPARVHCVHARAEVADVRERVRCHAPVGFDDHGHDSAPLSKSVRVLTVFALHKATAGVVVERAVRATALALAPKNRPTVPFLGVAKGIPVANLRRLPAFLFTAFA